MNYLQISRLSTMFRFVYITEKPTLEQRLDIRIPVSHPLCLSQSPGAPGPGSEEGPGAGVMSHMDALRSPGVPVPGAPLTFRSRCAILQL